jgi:hypothetical protein
MSDKITPEKLLDLAISSKDYSERENALRVAEAMEKAGLKEADHAGG